MLANATDYQFTTAPAALVTGRPLGSRGVPHMEERIWAHEALRCAEFAKSFTADENGARFADAVGRADAFAPVPSRADATLWSVRLAAAHECHAKVPVNAGSSASSVRIVARKTAPFATGGASIFYPIADILALPSTAWSSFDRKASAPAPSVSPSIAFDAAWRTMAVEAQESRGSSVCDLSVSRSGMDFESMALGQFFKDYPTRWTRDDGVQRTPFADAAQCAYPFLSREAGPARSWDHNARMYYRVSATGLSREVYPSASFVHSYWTDGATDGPKFAAPENPVKPNALVNEIRLDTIGVFAVHHCALWRSQDGASLYYDSQVNSAAYVLGSYLTRSISIGGRIQNLTGYANPAKAVGQMVANDFLASRYAVATTPYAPLASGLSVCGMQIYVEPIGVWCDWRVGGKALGE